MICIAALVCTVFAQSNSDLFLPNNFPGRIDITRVDTDISKNTLPKDFLWGFASAAVQNEGSASADGKSDSIWDVYARIPGKILNGTTPEVAVDEYVRYKETTQLLKEAGATAYRLSISWPRLIPGGHRGSPVNQLAVQHYNDVFDDLISNGITPLVTLYHWDLPQVLDSSYGGLLNATEFPQDYAYFADKAFEAFGEKVKLWLTFNEPISSCAFGYGIGMHAPGRCPDRKKCKEGNGMGEVLQCGHSILLAHAKAVDIYRKKYQNIQEGQISIAPNSEWAQPMNPDNSFDRFFAQAKMDFMLGWFADPIFLTGRYPLLMRAALFSQLPWFTSEESKMLKGSADFFAINHYS